VLCSGAAVAQTSEPDPGEDPAKATEETVNPSTGVTPSAAKPKTVKPTKRKSRPFEPTDRIEAESVISFPANI
jgi:hypothetical protein